MKTTLRTILITAAAISVLSACNKEEEKNLPLEAPVLEITGQTATSFTIGWEAVEGADLYAWEMNDEKGETDLTTLEFTDLESDASYTVKVKSVSSSSESEWAEISVTLKSEEEPAGVEFNITAVEEDYTLHVTTEPSDKELAYYFEPVPASSYAEMGNDPDRMFSAILSNLIMMEGGDAAAAFEKYSYTGDQEKSYDISAYLEPAYYVFIAGVSQEMAATTPVEVVEVPVDIPHSDNTFTITVGEVSQSVVEFLVTPSNDDQYAVVLYDTEDVEGMSPTQLRSFLLNLVTDNSICQGEETSRYERNIVPSHDYSFFVFGYEDGVITTDEITRKDVRTLDPEVVDELEFTFTIEVLGTQEVDVEIVPSNQSAAYYYEVVTLSDWENIYQESAQKVIENYAGGSDRVADYLDLWGSTGTQKYTYDDFVLKDPQGDDYVLFAIGFNTVDGELVFTTQDYKEFSTRQQGGGGDEEISFYFDIYPQSTPGEVYVEVTPTNDGVAYFYDVMSLADWAMFYQYEPSDYIVDMSYEYGYGSEAEYLESNGSMGPDMALFELTPGAEYVVFAIGYTVNGSSVTYLNYEYADFTVPDAQGGGDEDELTFNLRIEGDFAGYFAVTIEPSLDDVPYVYAVMTDLEYDDYYPDNIYDYFYQRYEDSGYDGTFAQYIESKSRTGKVFEQSDFEVDYYESAYMIIAAGVTIEGDDVTFYSPAHAEDYWWTY